MRGKRVKAERIPSTDAAGIAERVETWGVFGWNLPAAPGLSARLGPLVPLAGWLSMHPGDGDDFPFPLWIPAGVHVALARLQAAPEGSDNWKHWATHLKWTAWATATLSELPTAPSVFRKAADEAFAALDATDDYEKALTWLDTCTADAHRPPASRKIAETHTER